MIQERLAELLRSAVVAAGLLRDASELEIKLETLRQKEHGEFATSLAFSLAKRVGLPPREVAELIVRHLPPSDLVESAEVAGPGFINFRVTDAWFHSVLRETVERRAAYGRAEPDGRRVQVEFVSANPTGPLHIGHARNAALGDALARLLEFTGWEVEREFYFNDAGGQMDRFGASVEARYLSLLGRDAPVPEDGYHGDYVTDLARDILEKEG